MLTKLTEADWEIVLVVFGAVQSERGEAGHDDRRFLKALHYFTVHSITWRALRIRQLEQCLEAVLASQPVGCVRGVPSVAGGDQQDGACGAVLRQHRDARPRSRRPGRSPSAGTACRCCWWV